MEWAITATCGRDRLLARRLGHPVGGGDQFVGAIRPSKQFEVSCSGCVVPVCRAAGARPAIPTLILIGALDEWTPAADCSEKIDAWRTDGVPIEQVVYPGVHHSFYYPELQPGRTMFGHWLEYIEEAATDATRRMREFLKRHLD